MNNSTPSTQQDISTFKRIVTKLLFLALPFFTWMLIDATLLPRDYFSIRVWEAVEPRYLHQLLPGPFYPNQTLTKVEVGASAFRSSRAIPKSVTWRTNSRGFRYDGEFPENGILYLGDSNIAGCGSTQSETLTGFLSELLGETVFPYATRDIEHLLRDQKTLENSKQLVLMTYGELRIPRLSEIKDRSIIPLSPESPAISYLVTVDHFLKKGWYYFARSVIRDDQRLYRMRSRYANDGSERVFLTGKPAFEMLEQADVNRTATILLEYQKALQAKGKVLVFIPIPAAESVYYDLLDKEAPPSFLPLLIRVLNSRGLPTLNTPALFAQKRAQGAVTHHLDDGHLHPKGSQFLATAIAEWLPQTSAFYEAVE